MAYNISETDSITILKARVRANIMLTSSSVVGELLFVTRLLSCMYSFISSLSSLSGRGRHSISSSPTLYLAKIKYTVFDQTY